MTVAKPTDYACDAQCVDAALRSRKSIRAFLDRPVPLECIRQILEVARYAPSGTNTQPWRVHVIQGEVRRKICRALAAAYNAPDYSSDKYPEPYAYYPEKWISPFIDRRRKLGWDLYGLLGIAKTDKAAMHAQHARNYQFFDAPVGLIFTVHKILGKGSFLDYGMFLQSIMVAARARGLDTCPQAAFNAFQPILARELSFEPDETMVCAMALGYADSTAEVNRLVVEREPLDAFVCFHVS